VESTIGSRQGRTGDFGDAAVTSGLFLSAHVDDTRIFRNEDASVSTSNTGPTIPEGLFQKELRQESIDNSMAESQFLSGFKESLVDIFPSPARQESGVLSIKPETAGSGNSQIDNVSLLAARSSSSRYSGTFFYSLQGDQAPNYGGLFDDDDDYEDGDDLFGTAAPRVDSSSLLPSASESSERRVDDLALESARPTSLPDKPGVSQVAQQKNATASLVTSQFESESGPEVLDFSSAPAISTSVRTYAGVTDTDLAMSRNPRELVSNSQEVFKEVLQLPTHPTQAATVKSLTDVSGDDSWSGSDSGVDDLVMGKNIIQQQVQQEVATQVSTSNNSPAHIHESKSTEDLRDLLPGDSVHSNDLVQSAAHTVQPLPATVPGEGGESFVSSQPGAEGPPLGPSRVPLLNSRSVFSTV
jgi:hypothetical protein